MFKQKGKMQHSALSGSIWRKKGREKTATIAIFVFIACHFSKLLLSKQWVKLWSTKSTFASHYQTTAICPA